MLSKKTRARVQQSLPVEEESSREKKPRIRSPFAALLLGRVNKGVKGAPSRPADREIKHNQTYGRLVLDKRRMLRTKTVREYHCECECGNSVYLSAEQILTRHQLNSGCMGPECDSSPIDVRIWHNPNFALWFQLQQIKGKYRSDLDNEWGGVAYELPVAEPSEAYLNFLNYAKQQEAVTGGTYWVHKKSPFMPYGEGNVVFTADPDPKLFARNEIYVIHGDSPIKLSELCDSLGVDFQQALVLRGEVTDDDVLVEKLIEVSINEQSTHYHPVRR